MSRTVVVLARSPSPGVGKTRLRACLGDAVDELAVAFLADTLAWAAGAADRVLVAYRGWPQTVARLCVGAARLVEQSDGNLGDRIAAAVDAAFVDGARKVVLVGSDSPTLPAALLDRCLSSLDHAEAAIVPADDGGWVALSVRRPLGRTLAHVPWSTAATGAATVAALAGDRRPPIVLPAWYDVDDLAGLSRLRLDLANGGRFHAPRTALVVDRLLRRVPASAMAG